MESLNYHHLFYFWVVAREGSIAKACEHLGVAQPTISAQLRTLERSLKAKLFERQGRGLALTEAGRVTYRYAEEIFSLGRELRNTLKGRPDGNSLRLSVGVADAMPKQIVYQLLEPALRMEEPVRIACYEGKTEPLLAELALHTLDIVLCDAPLGPGASVRAFNHLLGECGITICGASAVADRLTGEFPACLDGAPFLLPTDNTMLRRSLDHWFDAAGLSPHVVAEFEDSALAKVFGQAGAGLFAAPTVIEDRVCRQYKMRVVGRIDAVREQFYAISPERRLKHPAVVAISEAARRELFTERRPPRRNLKGV